ncbi:hypothetical protein [Limnochorda pilosa]|uniref:Uncharacterized protein n=1 Tax=Limnochorda pilosa TaxID=1555112 RepID=A0A0K2SIM4_LIMPI|nr:hypothetical protein [Limnochorda pilosa]BAS26963.1 hypothetical protein LIP_1106 [Limnochorda pilosa]
MRSTRMFAAWALAWILVAGFLVTGVEAAGWIEWSPDKGLYWTDQAQAEAAVRIVEDDEAELQLLFQALNQLTVEEQARLMEQVQAARGGPGPAVVKPGDLLEAVGSTEAQRLREQVQAQEQQREREQSSQEDSADDAADDSDQDQDQDRDRDQDQDEDHDRNRDRQSDEDSDDDSTDEDSNDNEDGSSDDQDDGSSDDKDDGTQARGR